MCSHPLPFPGFFLRGGGCCTQATMEVVIFQESLQNFSHKKFYSCFTRLSIFWQSNRKNEKPSIAAPLQPLHVRDKPHQRGLRLTLFTNSSVGSFYLPFELLGKSERDKANGLTSPPTDVITRSSILRQDLT